MRAATASLTACQSLPATTMACRGWRLPPDGARCAAAKIWVSSAGSTACGVKARTERRLCSASVTESMAMSVAGIFILSPLAEQQFAFEPGFQLAVIGEEEDIVLLRDRPPDLCADRVRDLAHGARIADTQDPLELLQFENAIDRQFGLAERHRPGRLGLGGDVMV